MRHNKLIDSLLCPPRQIIQTLATGELLMPFLQLWERPFRELLRERFMRIGGGDPGFSLCDAEVLFAEEG